MFEEYFRISFSELVGTAVTIVGIWLVVQQLREAKKASQMAGILDLGDRFAALTESLNIIAEMASAEGWQDLDSEATRMKVFDIEENREAIWKVGAFYEVVGVLVESKSLDKKIAYKLYGSLVELRWKWVEKAVIAERERIGIAGMAENWEWLVKEFKKFSR